MKAHVLIPCLILAEGRSPAYAFSWTLANRQVWLAKKLLIGAFFAFCCAFASPVFGVVPADVSITLTTGDSATDTQALIVDSNNCAGGDGPHAAYVGGVIANTSGGTLTDLSVVISDFDTAAGFDLEGGQAATQTVGSLDAGESINLYWYIKYPCTQPLTDTLTITVSDLTVDTVSSTVDVTTRSSISANAGGIVLTTVLGPGAIVGQVITMTIEHEFGNTADSDEFYLQPTGASTFDASCLQLVGSRIVFSDVTAIPAGTTDQLYFVATEQQTGTSHAVTVAYDFLYLCDGVSTAASPYAAQTSGASNLKYTGNFETVVPVSFPVATNPYIITKTASPDFFASGTPNPTATYTVTISNPSGFDGLVDSITDILPAGALFKGLDVSSDVTAANSSSVPAINDTGTISWVGKSQTTYAISAGSSISLVYQVELPAADGLYDNSVTVVTGQSTSGPATETVSVGIVTGNTGTVTITDPSIPGDTLTVTVTDADLDTTGGTDTLVVDLVNDVTGETEMVTLTETGANTGVFTGTVATTFGIVAGTNNDGTFNTQAADTVTVTYNDALTATGGTASPTDVSNVTGITGTVTITDPSIPGDTLTVTVTDADLDTTGGTDTLVVDLVNDVTGETEMVTLTETGANTGVFTGTVATTFGIVAGTNNDGTFNTQAADTVTVTYNDALTATGGTASPTDVSNVDSVVGSLSGIVWQDNNHDDVFQVTEPLLANWTVELSDAGGIVATTTTDANGFYQIDNQPAVSGYKVTFRHPDTGVVWGIIDNLTLISGIVTIDQSLPIDPSGVVYDAITRLAVSGVTLTMTDTANTPLPVTCFLDPSQQNQVTAADGRYRFDMVPGAAAQCPVGETEYRISFTTPASHRDTESALIPPQPAPLDPTGLADPFAVAPNINAPVGGDPTTYYLAFLLENGDPTVINNHIPLDPTTVGAILISKAASEAEVAVGDMLAYTLTARNTSSSVLNNIVISDLPPAGFKYVGGSARIVRVGTDGVFGTADDIVVTQDPVGQRPIEFIDLDFAAGEQIRISYLLLVGTGVVAGDYTNQATPSVSGFPAGNTATATVAVVADPILDQTTIIGRVFHDRDGDGWQDPAVATGLRIQGGLAAAIYIPGSTTADFGAGPQQIADQSAPLVGGIGLGTLATGRIVIRAGVTAIPVDPIVVTTNEGTHIRIDADGRVTTDHMGDKALGMTGQDIRVTREVVRQAGSLTLVVTIANFGIDEEGIPGVRLATVSGLLIETDAHGRYHLADVDGGRFDRGRNFILKVDPETLPAGAVFTTENPRVVRITGGLMSRMNFGIRLPAASLAECAQYGCGPGTAGGTPSGPTLNSPAPGGWITQVGTAAGASAGSAGNGRLALSGGGVAWITEDPSIVDPRLDVITADRVALQGQTFVQPVHFSLYSNYAAFIDHWELAIYRAEDTGYVRPIKLFAGREIHFAGRVTWRGEVDNGEVLRAGDELVYVLRAYDAAGHLDETHARALRIAYPTALALVDGASPRDNRGVAIEDGGIYGHSNLRVQSIPIAGSRIRVHGAMVAPGHTVFVNGNMVPVDESGSFAVELHLPPGQHMLSISTTGLRGETAQQLLPITVSGDYFFMVGIADVTVGQNRMSGNIEPLAADDHFDEEVFVDGRIAFYLRGRIQGRYLITAQLDTRENELGDIFSNPRQTDPRSVFRRLDPDQFYPVYGDNSTTISDVDTQGPFYVRLEWDQSQIVWGNYNTSITGTEFAQYNRSLYGAQLQYRSAGTTRYGDPRATLTAFASEARSALAEDVFVGTGGSLYYLRQTDIVQGSDKARIEIRERDSNRTLENITLVRGRDYEIDEIQGRIILTRPLTQVTNGTAPPIISSEPLEGNDVFLFVEYEYIPDAFSPDDLTYGGRAQSWIDDRVGVGGTYIRERRDGADYELRGADVTLRSGNGTYLKLEYAESQAQQAAQNLLSDDGGLSFEQRATGNGTAGRALAIEGSVNLSELTGNVADGQITAWWNRRDAGFSTARIGGGENVAEFGARAHWRASDGLFVTAQAAVIDRDNLGKDEAYRLQVDSEPTARWRLSGEIRHDREEDANGVVSRGNLVGARAEYLVVPDLWIYGHGQVVVNRSSAYEQNDSASLGLRYQLGVRLGVTAEGTVGRRGQAAQVGFDFQLDQHEQIYGNYTLSTDRTDGQRGVATIGQSRQIGDNAQVYTENQFIHGDRQSGISQVYGLDLAPVEALHLGISLQLSDLDNDADSIEREAVSIHGSYNSGVVIASSKIEFRRDRGGDNRNQWLTANSAEVSIGEEFTVLARVNYSVTDNLDTGRRDGVFFEGNAGIAYRPIHDDRLNLLGKYTFLYDRPSIGQDTSALDEISHIASLEGIYAIDQHWELGAKIARKGSENRLSSGGGNWFETSTLLGIGRLGYHVTRTWEAYGEYRWLRVVQAEDTRQGWLAGINRHLTDNLSVGLGYNFTDFNDDLTNLDYRSHGYFVNLVGTF